MKVILTIFLLACVGYAAAGYGSGTPDYYDPWTWYGGFGDQYGYGYGGNGGYGYRGGYGGSRGYYGGGGGGRSMPRPYGYSRYDRYGSGYGYGGGYGRQYGGYGY